MAHFWIDVRPAELEQRRCIFCVNKARIQQLVQDEQTPQLDTLFSVREEVRNLWRRRARSCSAAL
jgi:hypothetical protein